MTVGREPAYLVQSRLPCRGPAVCTLFHQPATLFSMLLSAAVIPVLACCSSANAAELWRSGEARVNSWTVEEGLPGNAVLAMAQDAGGYLWLATLNGPARFDGARFVRVRLRDGLPSLLTQRMLTDNRGRLWIGTRDAGLTLLEGDKFRSFTQADGLPGENVHTIAQDSEGGVWIGLERGLARWDGHGKFPDMSPPKEKSGRVQCNSICCVPGTVFVVMDTWKIWAWHDNSWRKLPLLGKEGFRFDQIFVTRAGVLWSQLYPSGLARLEEEDVPTSLGDAQAGTNNVAERKQTWRVFGVENGLPDGYISCSLERTNGDLLLGSFEEGLWLFRNDRATPVALNEPPTLDGVISLREDGDGNLWLGTRTRGLLRFRSPRVRTLVGAEIVRVAQVAFEPGGRIWLGGGEGLWFGKEGAFTNVPRPAPLSKPGVTAITPAASGGVWFGLLNGGLWRFNPDRDTEPVVQLRGTNANVSVLCLADDGANGVWFGTAAGRIGHKQRGGAVKIFSPKSTVRQKRVSVLASEPTGGVWAGTDGAGVLRLDADGNILVQLSAAEGLPSKSVRCLLRDRDGVLWIGTTGGLCRWKGSRLHCLDSRHGLPEEAVASLAEDNAGRLWCAANNRLFRLDKQELDEVAAGRAGTLHPMIVGTSDGLNPVPFATEISSAAIAGPDGRLWFPRMWDVLTLDPTDFQRPPSPPLPRIEEVLIDGRPVPLGAMGSRTISVAPRQSQIEIRYTGFQWRAPETLRFRYRIAPLDEAWTEAGDQRLATFRHLPSGNYRFEVTATADGAAWAQPAATLPFVIQPLFWQTAWFRLLAWAGGVGIVAMFGWRRGHTLEQRRAAQELFSRRLLESQEIERSRIAAELHDSLGQNLVLMKNLAVLDGAPTETVARRAPEIAAAADRALEEVRALSYALRPPELDRLGLARAISALVRRSSEASGIRFESNIQFQGSLSPEADIQLFRIAQEAVNNLIKHSGAKTARVELWRDDAGLHLVVSDDGRGLAATKDKSGSGTGLGLSGIEERVRLLGAQSKWHSQPGHGTTLTLLIPIKT